ncbi:uncharacterized protein ACRADG_007333 [Cochliomyia hominivorax]
MMFSLFGHKLIFSIILLLFSTTKPIKCKFEWTPKFEITQNLSQAIAEIVNTIYVDKLHLSVFNFQLKVANRNREYLPEFGKIMDKTMELLSENIAIRLKNDIAIPTDNQRHNCVLLVDTWESLEFLYRDLNKYHLFVKGSYFIVLLTVPHMNHYYDELFEIFQINWRNGIIHANVLIFSVENVILLFHDLPFTRFHCRGVAPIIHNKFIDGHWLHKEFYVEKLKNLYGCPLVCATWEDWPYFKLLHGPPPENRPIHMGLEGQLLEYLAAKINFTIKLRWMSNEEIDQTIHNEQGVFDKLFSNYTDFVIGAFHYKPTSLEDSYAPSTTYYMSSYYFIISSKTDIYDPFTKLLLPFGRNIWLVLIFMFIIGNIVLITVIQLNHKFKSLVVGGENKAPAYNMIVVSLGGPVPKDPKVPFSRYLLMLWLLSTFILRTVYQGFLYHFIKNDMRSPPPKFISELFSKEYRILMSDAVYNSITDLPILYAKAELLNTTEMEAFEMLRRPQDFYPHKLAILTAHEYYGYYKYITPINYDFYVVPEKLFTQRLSIYMKKNSPFLKRFNMNIEIYAIQGLMNRWDRNLKYQGNIHIPTDDGPKPMNISQLFGAYCLLLIGLVGSTLAFLIEVVLFYGKDLICKEC